MPSKPAPEYSPMESRFYIALGKYMQTFSMLEYNLGLCIRWLANRQDIQSVHPFLERLSTQQKLDVLKELIYYKFSDSNSEMISDFNHWFKEVSRAKAARNRYVHGVWEFFGHIEKTPIRFTPIAWSAGVGKPRKKGDEGQKMGFTDFDKIVAEMDRIFSKFSKLRKKYAI